MRSTKNNTPSFASRFIRVMAVVMLFGFISSFVINNYMSFLKGDFTELSELDDKENDDKEDDKDEKEDSEIESLALKLLDASLMAKSINQSISDHEFIELEIVLDKVSPPPECKS